MARKPRIAPTTMKTVPSGRFDTCMKGASAVGGTEGATIWNAPESVGSPEGRAPPLVAVPPPVMLGTVPDVAADPEPVILAVGEGPVDVLVILFALVESVLSAEVVLSILAVALTDSADLDAACELRAFERFGRVEDAAEADIANSEMAAADRSGN